EAHLRDVLSHPRRTVIIPTRPRPGTRYSQGYCRAAQGAYLVRVGAREGQHICGGAADTVGRHRERDGHSSTLPKPPPATSFVRLDAMTVCTSNFAFVYFGLDGFPGVARP